MPELQRSLFYTINGVALWLMYIILRLPIPVVLFYLGRDLRDYPDTAWVYADPAAHTAWVAALYLSGTFLWLLSLMWFQMINAAVIKALVGGPVKKSSVHSGGDEVRRVKHEKPRINGTKKKSS